MAHTKWMCKYHIVFTPKYRRKVIYNQYKEDIRDIIKILCKYKGVEIIEGHLMPDHIHMLVSIPPKYSISQFMGYLKGKSARMIYDKHANVTVHSYLVPVTDFADASHSKSAKSATTTVSVFTRNTVPVSDKVWRRFHFRLTVCRVFPSLQCFRYLTQRCGHRIYSCSCGGKYRLQFYFLPSH